MYVHDIWAIAVEKYEIMPSHKNGDIDIFLKCFLFETVWRSTRWNNMTTFNMSCLAYNT